MASTALMLPSTWGSLPVKSTVTRGSRAYASLGRAGSMPERVSHRDRHRDSYWSLGHSPVVVQEILALVRAGGNLLQEARIISSEYASRSAAARFTRGSP